MTGHEVLSVINGNPNGLSEAEAARRLVLHGPNVLSPARTESPWRILVRQLRSVVVGLLVIATVVAWWTSEYRGWCGDSRRVASECRDWLRYRVPCASGHERAVTA
ncbi:MAG: cation-transporting P-type ATPase [Gemmatimonadaceae bacterium]